MVYSITFVSLRAAHICFWAGARRSMGMGSTPIFYMLIEQASPYPIREPDSLPGYTALSPAERQRFGEYTLFQLSFALYVLRKLDCAHDDLAKASLHNSITANMLFDAINGTDPCDPTHSVSRDACTWGHCWTAEGHTWCFDRATTPLMDFIVRIFDFGMATCRPTREEKEWCVGRHEAWYETLR